MVRTFEPKLMAKNLSSLSIERLCNMLVLSNRPIDNVGSIVVATHDGDFTVVARAFEERFGFGIAKNSRTLAMASRVMTVAKLLCSVDVLPLREVCEVNRVEFTSNGFDKRTFQWPRRAIDFNWRRKIHSSMHVSTLLDGRVGPSLLKQEYGMTQELPAKCVPLKRDQMLQSKQDED